EVPTLLNCIKAGEGPGPLGFADALADLGDLGPEAVSAVPVLKAVLKRDDQRSQLLAVLGRIGASGADLDAELAKGLADPNWRARITAVGALARIQKAAAVPALIRQLRDPDPGVREAVVNAL